MMTKRAYTVDWYAYAEKYDMLLEYNPFYQELRQDILERVRAWSVEKGSCLMDVGAGTGNYSVALAREFPGARVLHLDKNEAMNRMARRKKRDGNLDNLTILEQGIEEVRRPGNSVQGLLSVHALYAFPDPGAALRAMYRWLRPGGQGILVDPGRVVPVLQWQWAIGLRLLRTYGLSKTLAIFREGKVVSRQNRYIRRMQRRGDLWTHSPQAFNRAVRQAGFTILESRTCFRGLSDMAMVTKS